MTNLHMIELFMSTNIRIIQMKWNIYFTDRLFIYFVRDWRIYKPVSIDKCLIVCDRRNRELQLCEYVAKLKCMSVQMMQTPYKQQSEYEIILGIISNRWAHKSCMLMGNKKLCMDPASFMLKQKLLLVLDLDLQ